MRPSERNAGVPSSISAISHDVPPISTVIRSRRPAASPTILAPITPAAGPERKSRTDRSRAVAAEEIPPRDCMICKGAGTALGAQTGIQIGEITVHHRLDVGVERGGDGALVFAEGRIDLRRQRNENVGMARRDDLAGPTFVRII